MPDTFLLYLLEEPLIVLGRGMSPEEKKHLRDEVKSLKMEDVSSFMESLPPEFLTILRTDGLLRSLISKLGAPQRTRLLIYAKCAFRGLSAEASSESVYAVSRLKTSIRYIQLRVILGIMEFVSYVDERGRSLATKLRQLIYQIWSLAPILLSNWTVS
ncbi:aarF domain-containing protein kinase 1 [Salvia divinorum]|uniref:AarF domain-containing protein kinase 1 n=1 Tax=Salvia divinorum TaxID=28513 RepID=A0ABD1IGS4_SALDI